MRSDVLKFFAFCSLVLVPLTKASSPDKESLSRRSNNLRAQTPNEQPGNQDNCPDETGDTETASAEKPECKSSGTEQADPKDQSYETQEKSLKRYPALVLEDMLRERNNRVVFLQEGIKRFTYINHSYCTELKSFREECLIGRPIIKVSTFCRVE